MIIWLRRLLLSHLPLLWTKSRFALLLLSLRRIFVINKLENVRIEWFIDTTNEYFGNIKLTNQLLETMNHFYQFVINTVLDGEIIDKASWCQLTGLRITSANISLSSTENVVKFNILRICLQSQTAKLAPRAPSLDWLKPWIGRSTTADNAECFKS